ncbi:protein tantalus, partial [Phlebotomus argentipes]|uniref:protein tantalus n=1 Tax=Phlebotomus argentipes TaxID=94469 RepID=UPI0028932BA3
PKRCVQPTTEKQIEAYYLNKKVVKKCTPLETIFEEPKVVKEKETFLGNRKLNRSIKFSDGKNVSKVTVQNRRKKIKEIFGRIPKYKKIPMDFFLEYFTGAKPTTETTGGQDLPQAPDA